MNRTGKAVSWSVGVGVVLVAALLALALVLIKLQATRNPQTVNLPVISQVPDFALTNQLGQPVTLASLKGHAWVADIIFTRCAGPCPIMTGKMHELQTALPTNSGARLVSLTTDADYDTPAVLQKYAAKFGADAARWTFLTGDKVAVARLAIDGLKLTTVTKRPEERKDPVDLFVHSTIFVVVDKQGRLRGAFQTQGDLVNWPDMKQQILAALRQLENES
jgi:protein SCO1/2